MRKYHEPHQTQPRFFSRASTICFEKSFLPWSWRKLRMCTRSWRDVIRLSKMPRSERTFGQAANHRKSDVWKPMAWLARGRNFQENSWQICCDRHRCFDQKVDCWIVPSGGGQTWNILEAIFKSSEADLFFLQSNWIHQFSCNNLILLWFYLFLSLVSTCDNLYLVKSSWVFCPMIQTLRAAWRLRPTRFVGANKRDSASGNTTIMFA